MQKSSQAMISKHSQATSSVEELEALMELVMRGRFAQNYGPLEPRVLALTAKEWNEHLKTAGVPMEHYERLYKVAVENRAHNSNKTGPFNVFDLLEVWPQLSKRLYEARKEKEKRQLEELRERGACPESLRLAHETGLVELREVPVVECVNGLLRFKALGYVERCPGCHKYECRACADFGYNFDNGIGGFDEKGEPLPCPFCREPIKCKACGVSLVKYERATARILYNGKRPADCPECSTPKCQVCFGTLIKFEKGRIVYEVGQHGVPVQVKCQVCVPEAVQI